MRRHAESYESRPPFLVELAKRRLRASARLIGEIVERRRAEKVLRRTAEELARSNKELEQFAYVASHDLQEPLRVVTGYLQLIERRYKDRIDADANEFIDFAVDGAARMQQLISDLLEYSRVGTKGAPFAPTNVEAVLDKALVNLQEVLRDTGAVVTRDPLPIVEADPSLRQLPVVVLTTSRSEEDVLKAYDLHANCYITKPVDFLRFMEVVKSIEAARGLTEELSPPVLDAADLAAASRFWSGTRAPASTRQRSPPPGRAPPASACSACGSGWSRSDRPSGFSAS